MVEEWSDFDIWDHSTGNTPVLRRNARLKSEAFQNAILTSAKLALVAIDANGIIQLFNVGAERMLGYTAAEVVNRITVVELHDEHDLIARAREVSLELATPIAANLEAMICKAAWRSEDSYESALIHKNRKRVPVAILITASRDDMGGIIGYTLIATPIAVAEQSGLEPNEVPSIAQHASCQESDLLTRMSHEMRTPLSAILGFAQLMDSDSPSPTVLQKRRIDRILEAGWYLEKLIDMTHDLALIESETLSLSLETVPLAAAMRDCQAMIESQAQIRGVRVTFPVFDTPCTVAADRTRLRDVLNYLLCAAIVNSDVDVAVVVNYESGKDLIRVRIDHCGDGLSAERLSRHFLSYDGRQHKAIADGTALGVLLAKRLVELMGGVISADRSDHPRQLFAFDLKRVHVPLAVGRAATASVGSDAQVPNGCGSQSLSHSEDSRVEQR